MSEFSPLSKTSGVEIFQIMWSGIHSFFFFNTIVQKHTAHQLGKGELFSQQTEFFALEDLSLKA